MESTIRTEVKRIGRRNFARVLAENGVPENTLNNSLARGHFSKPIAIKLHGLTQVHASFWQSPNEYGTEGERL